MKKTITANISGSVFHIEEDAYEQLNAYLESIRRKFQGSPDADEIIGDIEGRIAELFLERRGDISQVVTSQDVDFVINTMGAPEDYLGEEAREEQANYAGSNERKSTSEKGYRKLYRDADDRWLGGVISGIAAYFDMKVLTLRLIFILSLFLGLPIIVYIIAWIIIPKAVTNAEKLEMRGEAVTVENIKRMFEDGVDAVEKGARKFASKAEGLGKEVRSAKPGNGVDRFFTFLGDTLGYLVKAFGKVLGALFLFLGITLFAALIAGLIGQGNMVWDNVDLMNNNSLGDVLDLIFYSESQGIWMAVACAVAILIPTVWLILLGVRLLSKTERSHRWAWVLLPFWIIALICIPIIATQIGLDFRKEMVVREAIDLEQPTDDVLVLSSMENPYFDDSYLGGDDFEGVIIEGDKIYMDNIRIDVERSPDTLYHLSARKIALGSNAKNARDRANNIAMNYAISANELSIQPYFEIPKDDKFRVQRMRLTLQVPVGKGVFLDASCEDVIYDIDNIYNVHDRDMYEQVWTMTQNGLTNRLSPDEVANEYPLPKQLLNEETEMEDELEKMLEEEETDEEQSPVVQLTPTVVKNFNMPMLLGRIR